MDEVDKYPGASKKEAGPIALARERTKTFRGRKIFVTSTPTLKTGHIWKAMEEADEIRHYFVPCPHCGKYIELKWNQVKFPDEEGMSYADRAEFAVYVCQECGGVITDRDKPQMLRFGEWRTVRKNTKFPRKIAFWINTLYSPFVRFSEMVKEFLKSKDDPEAFQNFVNSWLAEPWEDTKLKTNADLVMERQTDLPEFTVPAWTKLLTAGVDIQEASVYWTIRAWGNYLTSQNIAHGQAFSLAEVERIMNLQYSRQGGGEPMVVSLALIGSGDNTDLVYDFCASNSDWALPSKGASHSMDTHFKISKVNKTDSKAYGMVLVIIDTGKYPSSTDPKDMWFCCRRFFSWWGNSFILTYFQEVDDPSNRRLIERICDTENIRGNAYVVDEKCARAEITFIASENPVTALIDGKLRFHQYLSPYPPAEDILNVLEFDPYAIEAKLNGG